MTPIKVNFRNLQLLGLGDYDSGYKEGYNIGYETGYSVGFSDGAQNEAEKYNQTLLTLTGTTQPTAEEAITEINATLADALTGKGVSAEATETTAELVDKVGGIKDPQTSYDEGYAVGLAEGKALGDYVSNATTITFSTVSADDATALRHYPNLSLPRATTLRGCFNGNQAVETVGDIFAPNATDAARMFQFAPNITEVGKITYSQGYASYTFKDCSKLVRVGGLVGYITSIYATFQGCSSLEEITEPLDFSKMEIPLEQSYAFNGCTNLRVLGFVAGTIRYPLDLGSCGKLNDASRQSIKNGLADLTGQTTQAIYFHSDVLAKYTEDEIAEMLAKNWLVQ